jgi:hypothetical protein
MKLIAVHEMVHACGLTNDEHSKDDLFQASQNIVPGDTAAGDGARIQVGNREIWMPPLILSGTTVQHIKGVWT